MRVSGLCGLVAGQGWAGRGGAGQGRAGQGRASMPWSHLVMISCCVGTTVELAGMYEFTYTQRMVHAIYGLCCK